MPKIILASESRHRRELIARLGLDVACIAAVYEEEAEKDALGAVTRSWSKWIAAPWAQLAS